MRQRLNKLKFALEKKSIFLFCLIASFALFGSSLYFDQFIFDDNELIYQNIKIIQADLSTIISYWSLSNTPLIYNVWQLVSMMFGVEETFPFHFLNIFFHGVNCFLVYIWCTKILTICTRGNESQYINSEESLLQKASILGLAVFILHPVHVEAVVWTSSLKEVLAATFGLVSFICYLQGGEREASRYEFFSPAFYLLGMLTHPTIAALPLVYIWLDVTLFKKTPKEVFFRNGAYLLLLIAAVVIHKTVNPQLSTGEEQPIYLKIAVAFNALFGYLEKTFLPIGYSFDYMLSPREVAASTQALMWPKVKAFLAGIFIWVLILSFRSKKFHFFHYSIMMIALLVSVNLGLIGYAFQNISTIADRFLYLPSIGLSLFFAFIYLLIKRYQSAKILQIFTAATCFYLLFFMVSSIHRVHLWRSSSSLLSSSLENGYKSYPLHMSLGVALSVEKKNQSALEHFEQAYKLTQERDSAGKRILSISGAEPLAQMFRIYKLEKEPVKGINLYKEIMANQAVEVTPELAWFMADYFVSLNKWYEAEKLVEYAAIWYPESNKLKELTTKLRAVKQEALINSFLNLGIGELDNKNFLEADRYFKKALLEKKKLGEDAKELEDLLNLADSMKKESLVGKTKKQ